MTIGQILKLVEKSTLRKTERLSLREVEEESKGHWVAYVDDEESSYDVQIVIDGRTVVSRSCECEIDNIVMCSHQTKLLMAINDALKGKKIATKQPPNLSFKKAGTLGRLGGTAVGRLPSAQGAIPALWDRAPHQALLL